MDLRGLHPLTGETLFGCPLYDWKSNRWVVEWYGSGQSFMPEGVTDATPEQLDWIIRFPNEVKALQAKVTDWLIPF